MSTLTVYRTAEAARVLGVSRETIARFAREWYGRPGTGNRFGLTRVDLMVCRAWVAINERRAIGYDCQTRWLLDLAEQAIRANPRRWLYLCDGQAETFDNEHRAGSVVMWLDRPSPRGLFWLVDLWPWADDA